MDNPFLEDTSSFTNPTPVDPGPMIEVPRMRLEELLEAELLLGCLYSAGVENWEGLSEAYNEYLELLEK
mgnify:CR=1 FL=1